MTSSRSCGSPLAKAPRGLMTGFCKKGWSFQTHPDHLPLGIWFITPFLHQSSTKCSKAVRKTTSTLSFKVLFDGRPRKISQGKRENTLWESGGLPPVLLHLRAALVRVGGILGRKRVVPTPDVRLSEALLSNPARSSSSPPHPPRSGQRRSQFYPGTFREPSTDLQPSSRRF